MIALLLSTAAAVATSAPTAQCATVSPVTSSTDIARLQADADCFTAAAVSDKAAASSLTTAASAATAAAKYRLDRIKVLQALPPPPPPPPPTKTCPDGSVILATATCPTPPPPPPPPPPPVDCGNGVTVPAGQTCPPPPMTHCADGSMVPAGSACPPPPPPPVQTVSLPNGPSDMISGLPDVPDGLNMADIGTTTSNVLIKTGIPPSAAPDDVGAFRFICGPGHILADDPIMYPGQPGKSHLHQFYGITDANGNSTYQSLRQSTAPSTCQTNAKFVLNRSAYWMPALLDGKGNVVRPDYVAIYYKRHPLSDPRCTRTNPRALGDCVPLPNGLRFIFGRDMMNLAAPPTGNYNFLCQTPGGAVVVQPSTDMSAVLSACPVGDQFAAGLSSPQCWDGKNLDSPDHRSHTSYPGYGSWGYLKCDNAHPYVIPQFSMGARWTIAAGDDTSKWIFSSDVAMNQPRGTTFHGDWFGAWSNAAINIWTQNCIDKLLNCSAGVMGNGTALPGGGGPQGSANPRLVPISSIP